MLGVLLTGYGFLSDPALYEHSLGININLVWGLVLLVFGVLMIVLGLRGSPGDSGGNRAEAEHPENSTIHRD